MWGWAPDQRHSDARPCNAAILDRMFDCLWQQDALAPASGDFVEGWISLCYQLAQGGLWIADHGLHFFFCSVLSTITCSCSHYVIREGETVYLSRQLFFQLQTGGNIVLEFVSIWLAKIMDIIYSVYLSRVMLFRHWYPPLRRRFIVIFLMNFVIQSGSEINDNLLALCVRYCPYRCRHFLGLTRVFLDWQFHSWTVKSFSKWHILCHPQSKPMKRAGDRLLSQKSTKICRTNHSRRAIVLARWAHFDETAVKLDLSNTL